MTAKEALFMRDTSNKQHAASFCDESRRGKQATNLFDLA